MTCVPLTLDLAETIARHLSPRDRAEVLALRPASGDDERDLLAWAADVMRVPEDQASAWAVSVGDDPVAMGGIVRHPALPHLATSWLVGTSRKLEGGVSIMRVAIDSHRWWWHLSLRDRRK